METQNTEIRLSLYMFKLVLYYTPHHMVHHDLFYITKESPYKWCNYVTLYFNVFICMHVLEGVRCANVLYINF